MYLSAINVIAMSYKKHDNNAHEQRQKNYQKETESTGNMLKEDNNEKNKN